VLNLMKLTQIVLVGSILLGASAAVGETADQAAISKLLHRTFDQPNTQLIVAPIVVSGAYAVAGWTQAEMGGRALLRRKAQDWTLILCAGDGIKTKDSLVSVGVPSEDATSLAAAMATEEASLPAQRVSMFSRFEGMMKMDGSDHH